MTGPEVLKLLAEGGSAGIAGFLAWIIWKNGKEHAISLAKKDEMMERQNALYNKTINNHLDHLNKTLNGLNKTMGEYNSNNKQLQTVISKNSEIGIKTISCIEKNQEYLNKLSGRLDK